MGSWRGLRFVLPGRQRAHAESLGFCAERALSFCWRGACLLCAGESLPVAAQQRFTGSLAATAHIESDAAGSVADGGIAVPSPMNLCITSRVYKRAVHPQSRSLARTPRIPIAGLPSELRRGH